MSNAVVWESKDKKYRVVRCELKHRGDAFALCKTMPSDFCECGTCKFAKEALRKAGMV